MKFIMLMAALVLLVGCASIDFDKPYRTVTINKDRDMLASCVISTLDAKQYGTFSGIDASYRNFPNLNRSEIVGDLGGFLARGHLFSIDLKQGAPAMLVPVYAAGNAIGKMALKMVNDCATQP